MLIASLLLVGGLVVLIVASDHLVDAAARLAGHFAIAPVVIGVVVIGFGTSAPELVVSALAAAEGLFDLGVGNIIGSNIAKVLLVLGLAAAVSPVVVGRGVVRREVPLSLVAVLVFSWMIQGTLRRVDAVLLALLLVVMLVVIVQLARRDDAPLPSEAAEALEASVRVGRESLRAFLGLVFTVGGAQAVVIGGGSLAAQLGLSEGLIGLTLVAVGTSLPELATSVQAVRRGESELLVGNILGSNLFNAAAVGPLVIWGGATLGRDVDAALAGPATLAMLVATIVVSLLLVLRQRIGRASGVVLLVGYVATVALLAR